MQDHSFMQEENLYHKPCNRLFPNKWVLGLFLIFLFGIPRFVLVLKTYVSGQSQWVSMVLTHVKRENGSILGAILTHAGFNFGMGFLFFYAL